MCIDFDNLNKQHVFEVCQPPKVEECLDILGVSGAVYSGTHESHHGGSREVLELLSMNGLRIGRANSVFRATKVNLLGFRCVRGGVSGRESTKAFLKRIYKLTKFNDYIRLFGASDMLGTVLMITSVRRLSYTK
jgi:hypothetical protein